jgi:hypothetical protein
MKTVPLLWLVGEKQWAFGLRLGNSRRASTVLRARSPRGALTGPAMSWARLDDNIAHHPKILRAGPEAAFFWVLCLTYSQRFLTDGHVPDGALGAVGSWPASRARQLAAKLVQVERR